jgi:hypothetical protein
VVVDLGQAATQPVSEECRSEHAWLARNLNVSGVETRFREDSAYLSLRHLSTQPSRIEHYIVPPDDLPDDATIIVDISDAPYELLNEPLLVGLVGGIERMLAGGPRTVLLLLSKLPKISLLWEMLKRATDDAPGRVLVLDDDGDLRPFGLGRRGFTVLQRDWPERRRLARGTATERFARRVLSRLGHFSTAHGARCTNEWKDFRGASTELQECVDEYITAHGKPGQRLIVCGPCSRELRIAVQAAADERGLQPAAFAATADDLYLEPRGNMVIFEHVRSGDTLAEFRQALTMSDAPVAVPAFAVIARPDADGLKHAGLPVVALVENEAAEVRQQECERCTTGALRLTDPRAPDPFPGIDATTMWWMLDRVEWKPEAYGHPVSGRYPLIPDFLAVFEQYGDWIATKYEELAKGLGLPADLVVVCPAEPAVRDLVRSLATYSSYQLVPVEIERDVIEEVAADPAQAAEMRAEADRAGSPAAWQRQLLDLARHPASAGSDLAVVALDEFNASGTTAAGLVALLGAFGVPIDAYLPFVDWSGRPSASPPSRSLYAFYNPRPKP